MFGWPTGGLVDGHRSAGARAEHVDYRHYVQHVQQQQHADISHRSAEPALAELPAEERHGSGRRGLVGHQDDLGGFTVLSLVV